MRHYQDKMTASSLELLLSTKARYPPWSRVRQYHSDLSDQSALENRVRIRVRLTCKVALF